MLKALFITSIILFTTSQAIAFPGEARRYFKDWQTCADQALAEWCYCFTELH